MVKLTIMAITSALIGSLIFINHAVFSYADFKDYCNTLLSVSGMVLLSWVFGLHLYILMPSSDSRSRKIKIADFTATMQDTRRLESIVGSIMQSGSVAMCIMLIYLIKLVASGLPIYLEYRDVIKSSGAGLVIFLTFVQCSAVVSVIYANYLFIDDLHNRREAQERNADVK